MGDVTKEIIILITTLVTTIGTIAVALIQDKNRVKKKGERVPKKCVICMGAAIGIPAGVFIGFILAFILPKGDPCARAEIIAPVGADTFTSAASYLVDNNTKIAWESPDPEARCVMIVQTYQGGDVTNEYKNIVSGTSLDIGKPGSGETEIKIWLVGNAAQIDSIFVWIK